MFKNHPKGLIGAALSNMGERFGFYIMMAVLLLFLDTKYGFIGTSYGTLIYSVFYALIYMLALVGGIIADKTKKYKGTITVGLILMTIGYLLIAYPTETTFPFKTSSFILSMVGLFTIAFGNGLFKGNLQAVVGQLYDENPQFEEKREAGFQIFYMFINLGSVFAPLTAVALRNWWVQHNGFQYNPDLPSLAQEYLTDKASMTTEATNRLSELASEVSGTVGAFTGDLAEFSHKYINVFIEGYHYSFAIAIIAMAISIAVFFSTKNKLPNPGLKVYDKDKAAAIVEMDAAEVKQRIYALMAVFAVVIFFWFAFHQNGVTLTYFARDYTQAIKINLGFTTLEGAEVFQSFNPLFVVLLTPIVMSIFGWLRAKKIHVSTPKKIAIGMGIAALAFTVMAIGSIGLPTTAERVAMGGLTESMRVTPWLLIGTYLILTTAELFISPLGIAFVSKVAPPKYQGLMQGLWLTATAVGNQLLFVGAIMYNRIPMWATWTMFVVACMISMCTMLFMLKWLERVTD